MRRSALYITMAAVLLSISLSGVATAQENVGDGRFDDAIKTDDGYVVSGTLAFEGEGLDGHAVKVDEEGDEIWSLLTGSDGVDYLSSVAETEDGYLFAGAKGAPNKNVKGDAWVVKTDTEGNVEWEETYAGESRSAFYSINALEDGYIAMGSSNEDGGIIVRLDENGERLWNTSHGIVVGDSIRTDEGFLVAGGKLGSSGLVTWLAEIGDEGELVWENTYNAGQNRFSTILPVESGYMLGTHRSNEVVKVDEEGGQEWTTEVDMQYIYDIEHIEDGRFAVGGGIPTSGIGGPNSRTTSVVEIDGSGDSIRERDFGYSVSEVLNPEVEEGEYVIVAQSTQEDVLAVVQEPQDSGSEGSSGSGSETQTDEGEKGDENADGDANPLGTPAQTLFKTAGILVLVLLGARYRE